MTVTREQRKRLWENSNGLIGAAHHCASELSTPSHEAALLRKGPTDQVNSSLTITAKCAVLADREIRADCMQDYGNRKGDLGYDPRRLRRTSNGNSESIAIVDGSGTSVPKSGGAVSAGAPKFIATALKSSAFTTPS
jgi:hypothetical protein